MMASLESLGNGRHGFASADLADGWQKHPVSHLISDEIRHSFASLLGELESLKGPESVDSTAALQAHVPRLRSLFAAMDQLSRLAQEVSMGPGECMSVEQVLRAAVAAIPFSHCDYHQDVSGNCCSGAPDALYGSTDWMECALTALFKGMEACAERGSQIQLTIRQQAGFVKIHAQCPAAAPAPDSDSPACEADQDQVLHIIASTHVPLATRIVEMHGGKLQVRQAEPLHAQQAYGIESFTLHLPTRNLAHPRPAHCENCTVRQQAAAYAKDLAALMPGVPAEATLSGEERALLAGISTGA